MYTRAGYLKYTIALGTLQYLEKETKYVPWRTALNSLGFLDDILSDRPGNGYFQVGIGLFVFVKVFMDCQRKQRRERSNDLKSEDQTGSMQTGKLMENSRFFLATV